MLLSLARGQKYQKYENLTRAFQSCFFEEKGKAKAFLNDSSPDLLLIWHVSIQLTVMTMIFLIQSSTNFLSVLLEQAELKLS